MKNRLMIILIALSVSLFGQISYADTCPPIDSFDPYNPPSGWTMVAPPVIPDADYQFNRAVHFLDTMIYPLQVMCIYATCSEPFCPAFSIVSDRTYKYPNHKEAPWDEPSRLKGTLTCAPDDHDPSGCVFH